MTIQETGAIMDVLSVAYPQYYRNVSTDDKYNASCLWAEMFASDPVEIVVAAVKWFIASDVKGFPPNIGIIKDHILKITIPPQKSAMEAWADVKKALSNSGYSSIEEFEKLDPVTKRIVGSPGQLREWALNQRDVLDTVIASNFRESYNACAKSFRERQMLPPTVSEMVSLLSEKMDMAPKQDPPKPMQPKALPISVSATMEEIKQIINGEKGFTKPPEKITDDEFEKKRAELLAQIDKL